MINISEKDNETLVIDTNPDYSVVTLKDTMKDTLDRVDEKYVSKNQLKDSNQVMFDLIDMNIGKLTSRTIETEQDVKRLEDKIWRLEERVDILKRHVLFLNIVQIIILIILILNPLFK